jgi:DNA-binding response OmpR family regulator
MTDERRILLVEDELGLRMTLSDRLRSEGYQVETAANGDDGLRTASKGGFDALILDVMLPGRSGFDICRDLRQQGDLTPILMLTARGQTLDKVTGLKLGADDYLTKPFETLELLARIEALLRRRGRVAGTSFQFDDVRVDFRSTEVWRGDSVLQGCKFPRRSSSYSSTSSSTAARPSRARCCCMRCGDTNPRPRRARWTSTWRGCGKRSRKTRRSPS